MMRVAHFMRRADRKPIRVIIAVHDGKRLMSELKTKYFILLEEHCNREKCEVEFHEGLETLAANLSLPSTPTTHSPDQINSILGELSKNGMRNKEETLIFIDEVKMDVDADLRSLRGDLNNVEFFIAVSPYNARTEGMTFSQPNHHRIVAKQLLHRHRNCQGEHAPMTSVVGFHVKSRHNYWASLILSKFYLYSVK